MIVLVFNIMLSNKTVELKPITTSDNLIKSGACLSEKLKFLMSLNFIFNDCSIVFLIWDFHVESLIFFIFYYKFFSWVFKCAFCKY